MVALLPFIEENVTYNQLANASKKFRYPAFQMKGGPTSFGCRYNAYPGGGAGNAWWRHFSTIELDEVRCPSFAGDPEASHQNYQGYGSASQPDKPMPDPSDPWNVIITNYKATCATHFACMVDPVMQLPMIKGPNGEFAEQPNGVIIPPATASSKGIRIGAILDGTSKTIVLAESKEQKVSSWYDGCTAWLVAAPAGSLQLSEITNQSPSPAGQFKPPQPWKGQPATPTPGLPLFWRYQNPGTAESGLNYGPKTIATKKFAARGGGMLPATAAGYQDWFWGPSSDHSGGIILHCWADAHVSGLAEDTDPVVYIQLVTRAGREPVADPGQE
jgi:hypothetical protein